MSPQAYYKRDGNCIISDGYHFSDAEIEAYSVPHRVRTTKCVDLYIPFRQCMDKISFFEQYKPKYILLTKVAVVATQIMRSLTTA